LGFLGLVATASGCSTVGAPVLRHETGDTLGEKKVRVFAHFEMSRIFEPGAASDAQAAGISQNNSVFQGSLFGIEGEVGVLPQLDVQLGANFTATGGGWRLGSKYQFIRRGRFSVAGMAGFSSGSGSTSVSYITATGQEQLSQTLTAWTLDFSIPASLHVSSLLTLYGGPMMLHSGVSGSYGGTVVSDADNDFGLNLGVRVSSGIFVGDIEAAGLMVQDPFVGGERIVPYAGVSFGVLF